MEDIIDIIVTETTNLIEITSQPTDEIIDVNIIDNREDVTLNVTPTVVEININSLTGNFGVNWGEIDGTLSNQTDLQNALNLKADLVDGKVPSSQLPSYVDDVVEVANYASLPVTGETGKIYVTIDTNYIYRWTGSVYVEIKDSSAVWGAITGTLSNQTDLQNALNAKLSSSTAASTYVPYTGATGNVNLGLDYSITAALIIKSGGTSTQFLKADGSIDTNTYLTTSSAASTYVSGSGTTNYLPRWSSSKVLTDSFVYTNGNYTEIQGQGLTASMGIVVSGRYGSVANAPKIYSSDETTGVAHIELVNGGGEIRLGVEKSTGGQILPGSSAYATVLTAGLSGRNLEFGTNNTKRMTINGSNGGVGIGTDSLTGYNLRVTKNITGATTSIGIHSDGTIQSDVTGAVYYISTNTATVAAAFTLNALTHFRAAQATYGAGSIVTSQYGFSVDSSLIGATNNYGFFGNIPAATNRYNLYMAGTAGNYLGGSLGIGAFNITNTNLFISKTMTGSIDSYHVNVNGTIQSDVTNSATYFRSSASTAAATFTLGSLYHFIANQGTLGAGSSVGSQFGFRVNNNLTGATNNYGFYGDIASASGRWNLYMNGTANNHLAGNLLIGSTADNGSKLQVTGAATFSSSVLAAQFYTNSNAAASGFMQFNYATSNTSSRSWRLANDNVVYGDFAIQQSTTQTGTSFTNLLYINPSGNVGIGTTSPMTFGSFTNLTIASSATNNYSAIFLVNSSVSIRGSWYQNGGNQINFGTATAHPLVFDTSDVERMRITSGGDLLINMTSGGEAKLRVSQAGTYWNTELFHTYSTQYFMSFKYNGTTIGSIIGNGTMTSYNVTSDYRLKEDLKPINGLDIVNKIKVYDYKWKADNSRMDGVLAHELQEVLPYAVTGVKDGKEMQQVDYSKIVPVLIQSIKELKSKIETLENK